MPRCVCWTAECARQKPKEARRSTALPLAAHGGGAGQGAGSRRGTHLEGERGGQVQDGFVHAHVSKGAHVAVPASKTGYRSTQI